MERIKQELFKRYNWLAHLRELPKMKEDILFLLLTSGFINVLGLALPLVMMQIFDRVLPYKSVVTLGWLVSGVIIAILFETLLRTFRGIISNWISSRFEHLVSTNAINSILNLELNEYEKDGAGVHLERLNAIPTLRSFYSGQLFQILLDLPFAFLYIWVLYYIGGKLVMYTIILLSLFVLLTYYTRKKYAFYKRLSTTVKDRHINFLVELLGGMHTIKSMAMEELMLRRYESIQTSIATSTLKMNNWNQFPMVTGQFFSNVNRLGIIALGAGAVISGSLTVGAMTACAMVAARIMQPFQQMAGFWLREAEATIAQDHLNEIIDMREHNDVEEPTVFDIDGKLTLHNLTYNFIKSEEKMFSSVSLCVNPGELAYFECDNQNITSSLTYLMTGVAKPKSGDVFVDEFALKDWDLSIFKGRVGYLSRNGRLFSGTLLENITMYNSALNYVALDIAPLLQLDKMVADLPKGYETDISPNSNNALPDALVQRICLARVLVTRPRILIIDRLLTALDSESLEITLKLLDNLRGLCTIIITGGSEEQIIQPDRYFHIEGDSIVEKSIPPFIQEYHEGELNPVHWKTWVMQTANRWEDLVPIIHETGLEEIDQGFKQLGMHMIDVNRIISQNDQQTMTLETLRHQEVLLDAFYEFAEQQCRREEQIIEKYALPYQTEQKQSHDLFLANLRSVIEEYRGGKIRVTHHLKNVVMDWFLNHINVLDRDTFQLDNFVDKFADIQEPDELIELLKPTGVPFVDHDHIVISKRFFLLFAAVENEDPLASISFMELMDYVHDHFAHEERFIEENRLHGLIQQKEGHYEMITLLETAQRNLTLKKLDITELRQKLLPMWIKHVNGVDRFHFSTENLLPVMLEHEVGTEKLNNLIQPMMMHAMDEEHQSLITELCSIDVENSDLMMKLDRIYQIAEHHFRHEEEFMEHIDHATREIHRAEHEHLLQLIGSYLNDVKERRTHFSKQLRNRIIVWWIQHINNTDYRTFVIYKGRTRWDSRTSKVGGENA